MKTSLLVLLGLLIFVPIQKGFSQIVINRTSLVQPFNGTSLSDNFQQTSSDGGIVLSQADTLQATLTNVTAYKKVYEMGFRNGVSAINIINDASLRVQIKSSVAITLQFRLYDSTNNTTGDHFSTNISIPNTNQWTNYTINFGGRIAATTINASKINRIVVFSTTAASSGIIKFENLELGRIPSGTSVRRDRSFENDFTGTVINDDVQTTGGDGGVTQVQNNELIVTYANNTSSFKKAIECKFRPSVKGISLRNQAILSVKIKATAPINLDWRLSDSAALDGTGVIISIPGDNVYRVYNINFLGRLNAGPINPNKVRGFLAFNTGAYSGVITMDSLRLGREPGGSSVKTAKSLINDFEGSVLDDDNLTIRGDGGITHTQNGELITKVAPNTSSFKKIIDLNLKREVGYVNIINEPYLRIKIKSTAPITLDWRLSDPTKLDNAGSIINIPGDSTYRTYTINFNGRVNARIVNADSIRGFLAFNTASFGGTVTFDSLRFSKEPGGTSFLTSNQFFNEFVGEVINDDNQFTSSDGSILLKQQNSNLEATFNNSGNYQKIEMNFRPNKPHLDFSNGGYVRIQCRANTNLALLIRVKDRRGRFSNETSQAIILVPRRNISDFYKINLTNFLTGISKDSIAGVSIWNQTNQVLGAGNANGTLFVDSLIVGSDSSLVSIPDANPFVQLEAFPNPAKNSLYLHNLPDDQVAYTVTDQLGKIAKRGQTREVIDISELPKGLYHLVLVDQKNYSHRLKFIKE